MSNRNQAQRNRNASLPARNENIAKQKAKAQQVEQSQMQQTPIPQTIILESNRLTSRQEDISAEGYSTNHRWTTEFSNGGIQIRKGDEIRINSAYISSIGVGDLIEWDVREDSATQDNKANWLFSYYGCNDHLNDKRAGYNIKEKSDTAGRKYGGHGRFNFDCDNSPCPLMRITNTSSIGTPTQVFADDNGVGEITAQRLSWLQDPYLKCRFFGDRFTIKTPVLDDHYQFVLHNKIQVTNTGDNLQFVTGIQVIRYSGTNTLSTIDPRHIMGIGQTLHFQSQIEPHITANPATHFHDKNINNWIFTIQDFRVAVTATGIPVGTILIVVDSLNDLTGIDKPLTANVTNTAKVLIGNLPSICSSGETGTAYQHTPLSTIVWTGTTADNYIEVGDKLKQYAFAGVSSNKLDVTQFNLMTQLNDSQTANKVVEVEVSSSEQTKEETKIEIHMISLKATTGGDDRHKQQVIQFQFPISSDPFSNYQKMIAGQGVGEAFETFTSIIGTNCIVFDFFGNNSISGREIAVSFIYDNADSFSYDADTNIIELNNVRRNQNSDILLNLLTDHQPFTFNVNVDNSEKYYIIKTPNFFTDITAHSSDEQDQQFRGETWDWDTRLAEPIYATKRICYLGYVKDNNDELTTPNLTIRNNRNLSHGALQSNSFNIQNPSTNLMVNRPIKYAGFNEISTDTIRVKHYAQHELKIEDNYSSPSDIATSLTDQTHYVGKAIDKNGNEVSNSESNGIIQNVYYIPVWSSAGGLTDTSVNGDTNINQNYEDIATGKLGGKLQHNSFLLSYKMKNSALAYYSIDPNDQVYADDGEYDIYFKTLNTYINKPLIYQDPAKNNPPLQLNGADQGVGNKFSLVADLDNTRNQHGIGIAVEHQTLQQAKTFSAKDKTPASIIGFPIEYAPDSHISQYCGSNNISISWDDTSSRFKLDFLHMSATSKFLPTEEGVVQEGGALSATIYYPAPRGKVGNLYKMPRTRCGGINIENWTSQDFSNITTPQQVRTLCNLDSSINLSHNWFVCDHNNISSDTPELQKNYDSIGNKFWNKLGFLNSQLYKTEVGSLYDTDIDRYIVKGTTDNLVDIADATITAEEPAENTPFFFTQEKFEGGGDVPATYQFSSIGALNFNSHLSGYGLPNTSGVPLTFRANETLANLNIDIVDPNSEKTKYKKEMGDAVSRPAFSSYLSTYNPDREMVNGYSFTTEPKSMVAQSLPIKTEFPYFYVMSDLIETNFNISANKGSGLNCLGVISKLNAEGDFFFQYQAPQSFFATKDKLISSITTELRTPTLGVPQALSPYSSVIYQISRYAPTPIQVAPPVWLEQKMVFDQMKNLLQDIATSLSPSIAVSADQQVADGLGGQIQESIPTPPIQNSPADEREIYQSMINSISGRITEPLPEVQRALPSLRNIQNPLQLTDEPAPELTEEQLLNYQLAVNAIRGRVGFGLPRIGEQSFDFDTETQLAVQDLATLRGVNRFGLPAIQIQDDNNSEISLTTLDPQPPLPVIGVRQNKPDDDIPSMLGDSVAQSSVPPSYRGRSLPSYATGSLRPPSSADRSSRLGSVQSYTSALSNIGDQTITERIQEQRKEEDEMD